MILLRFLLAAAILFPPSMRGAEILVFAAASLTDALREIGSDYEKNSKDKVRFNFAASSILARQIQEGARADMFFSADHEKMDVLEKNGFLKGGTRKNLLSNALVIVVAKEHGFSLTAREDLKKTKRIALAEPNTVPAGIYARKYLEQLGLWMSFRERVIPTENVRGALAAVESGNADAAIVYKTDAAISKKARIAFEVPAEAGPKISYPVALLKEGKAGAAGERFLAHLQSKEAAEIFSKFGFVVLVEGKRE
jgi:molybdate transport system substrate-binding protein